MSKKPSASERAKPEPTLSDGGLVFARSRTQVKTLKGNFMANAASVLSMIKAKEVKFVDLRFTDPRGKWQHVTFDLSMVDEDFLTEGTMFDGSSIAGWKGINESAMT